MWNMKYDVGEDVIAIDGFCGDIKSLQKLDNSKKLYEVGCDGDRKWYLEWQLERDSESKSLEED